MTCFFESFLSFWLRKADTMSKPAGWNKDAQVLLGYKTR